MKDLLRIADLSRRDLFELIHLATVAKDDPTAFAGMLEDELVVAYFAKPSTRTRLSFAAAVARLGGTIQVVTPQELQLGRGETIEDTAAVMSRYARAFVIRTFDDDEVTRFASAATIPVINALADGHHPCQALTDIMTMGGHFGHVSGLRVAYLGDGSNVAASLLEACALAGADITIATPPGHEVADDVLWTASRIAADTGALVLATHDPLKAAATANVIYTDVWRSMGVDDSDGSRRSTLSPYQVNDAVMAEADEDAIFLHCLPAHRGEEVTAEVIDGPQSLVFDQAENRLYTAVAVLVATCDESLEGAAA